MGRIQSSVGLVTNIPIEDTVNKLMELAAQPRNLLTNRTKLIDSERLAITQLSTLLLAFQFETTELGKASLFDSKEVSSSDEDALAAVLAPGGNPAAGNYLFTPVQTASAQQFLSQTFTTGQIVGAGSFTFQTGGFLDKGISLDELNSGAGVQRGKIRVTDRSGATAIIDLSYARTIDDVLRAISDDTTVNVTAEAVGDTIKLLDHTGGGGNLSVQNVAGGTTATNLGLAAINVAANEATGADIFTLHALTKLSTLNDGNGVRLLGGSDLQIALADLSVSSVDLGAATTIGDVLTAINAASPTKFSAAIAADGNRLVINDLTAGAGTFSVTNFGGGTAAKDLGLTTTAAGGVVTGRRLVSGLRDTLVTSLKGGLGLGTLGTFSVTNRNNVSSFVNLAGVETLSGIVSAINTQATGVTAQINTERNGIVLTDTTGATTSNLIIADSGPTTTATALGIVANVAATSVNSAPLKKQSVSTATLLSSLNGGAGITIGDFKITDSTGSLGAVDLNPVGNVATTVGDVIDRINALIIGVEARINDNGDGIVLQDTAGGTGNMTVTEVGNGSAAKGLGILGTSVVVTVDGATKKVIDGTKVATVTIDADDKLADVAAKINALGAGVGASVFNDGTGQRLSLSVEKTGIANELLVDTTGSAFALDEISGAQDALVLYGTASSSTSGLLISSATNNFTNVVGGINLTVNEGTLEPVTVNVTSSSATVVKAVEEFVDAFNSVRELLDEATVFDEEDQSTGILFGTREALRVETDLARAMSARYFGVGDFESLEEIGISLDENGKMVLDAEQLAARFAEDPESLKTLFTDKTRGVAAKLDVTLEQLAGEDGSLLVSRSDALTAVIETNSERIVSMDDQFARQRERLLMQFFQLETLIAQMQRGLSALSAIQPIAPLTS